MVCRSTFRSTADDTILELCRGTAAAGTFPKEKSPVRWRGFAGLAALNQESADDEAAEKTRAVVSILNWDSYASIVGSFQ